MFREAWINFITEIGWIALFALPISTLIAAVSYWSTTYDNRRRESAIWGFSITFLTVFVLALFVAATQYGQS